MTRCAFALASLLAVASVHAQSQTHRHFPVDALRGDIKFGIAPEVLLNGKPARLSPGSRLQGANGMGVLPAEVIGKFYQVHYTLHTDGQVKDVWVLNSVERQNRPWPATRDEAARWVFDPATQVWSKR